MKLRESKKVARSLRNASILVLSVLICLFFVSGAYSADRLIVKDSGGTARFTVDENGNVELGASSPVTTDGGTLYVRGDRTDKYISIIMGHSDTAGGVILGKHDSRDPFMTFSGWDSATRQRVEMFYGGGQWGARDANIHMWYVDPDYTGGINEGVKVMTLDVNGLRLDTDLDVYGTIYQRGGTLHADYVFEPGYELESIESHAEFMKTNKHLKAMPKATKDENGLEVVNLGSHNRGLLEELEKAHLYIDQLNERLKVLEAKLQTIAKN